MLEASMKEVNEFSCSLGSNNKSKWKLIELKPRIFLKIKNHLICNLYYIKLEYLS